MRFAFQVLEKIVDIPIMGLLQVDIRIQIMILERPLCILYDTNFTIVICNKYLLYL